MLVAVLVMGLGLWQAMSDRLRRPPVPAGREVGVAATDAVEPEHAYEPARLLAQWRAEIDGYTNRLGEVAQLYGRLSGPKDFAHLDPARTFEHPVVFVQENHPAIVEGIAPTLTFVLRVQESPFRSPAVRSDALLADGERLTHSAPDGFEVRKSLAAPCPAVFTFDPVEMGRVPSLHTASPRTLVVWTEEREARGTYQIGAGMDPMTNSAQASTLRLRVYAVPEMVLLATNVFHAEPPKFIQAEREAARLVGCGLSEAVGAMVDWVYLRSAHPERYRKPDRIPASMEIWPGNFPPEVASGSFVQPPFQVRVHDAPRGDRPDLSRISVTVEWATDVHGLFRRPPLVGVTDARGLLVVPREACGAGDATVPPGRMGDFIRVSVVVAPPKTDDGLSRAVRVTLEPVPPGDGAAAESR